MVLSAQADTHIAEMDMIVTATSGAGKKVLDIMKVKPGCVITDVARPLDLPPEEVAKRPDVLVIESGEIQLPGEVHDEEHRPAARAWPMPAWPRPSCWRWKAASRTSPSAARSSGRRCARSTSSGLKHGMRLAAISGVNGVFSDEDIARVRGLALAARKRKSAASARAGQRGRQRAAPAAL